MDNDRQQQPGRNRLAFLDSACCVAVMVMSIRAGVLLVNDQPGYFPYFVAVCFSFGLSRIALAFIRRQSVSAGTFRKFLGCGISLIAAGKGAAPVSPKENTEEEANGQH